MLGDAIASRNCDDDVKSVMLIITWLSLLHLLQLDQFSREKTFLKRYFWQKRCKMQKTSVRRGREDTCKEHSVYHANVMSFSSKARKWQISHLPRPMPIYTCFTDVFFVESGKRLQHQWTGCKAGNVVIIWRIMFRGRFSPEKLMSEHPLAA